MSHVNQNRFVHVCSVFFYLLMIFWFRLVSVVFRLFRFVSALSCFVSVVSRFVSFRFCLFRFRSISGTHQVAHENKFDEKS